jgi:radical SAM protein with 4Fe4S-binding SPASM domain
MAIYKRLGRLFKMGRAFRQKALRLSYFPSRIWVELTDHCNLRCPRCPNKDLPKDEKGFMSFSLFQDLMQQCRGRVDDIYLFHRGESLLHPEAPEMIAYAQKLGISCRLHTNATLLTPTLSRKLIQSGLKVLSFSFDGYQPAEYEAERFPARFEGTLARIKDFLILKKEAGSSRPVTVLQMMRTKPPKSDTEWRDFLGSLTSLGLDRVVFRRPHNWGGALPSSPEGDKGTNQRPLGVCTFPWYALVVYWDGRVGPCPQDFFARIVVGDLNRNRLEEIWNGPSLVELRKRIGRLEYTALTPCRDCDRPRRRQWAGVPTEYLTTFLQDRLAG